MFDGVLESIVVTKSYNKPHLTTQQQYYFILVWLLCVVCNVTYTTRTIFFFFVYFRSVPKIISNDYSFGTPPTSTAKYISLCFVISHATIIVISRGLQKYKTLR